MYFRHFNQNHLKSDAGRIGWLRQVEALTELYDYSLLLECTQNYACEVKVNLSQNILENPVDHKVEKNTF